MKRTSEISGFYKLNPEERLEAVRDRVALTEQEVKTLRSMGGLNLDLANRMVENVIGAIAVPLGIAVNFLVNGKDYLVPMAIEEPSVVAAASNAAKMARVKGGFTTSNTGPVMIGQIQAVDIADPYGARMAILAAKEEILERANKQDPMLVSLGGGVKDLDVKVIETFRGSMVITELHVDCRDAMGANVVNTMAEAVAPIVERASEGRVLLRIISNLADKRLVRSKAIIAKEAVGGHNVVEGIIQAYAFAAADPYRCATHNKGIMNGIVAVALATGNDTRALESGAHAYAARNGVYSPLTVWETNKDGDLVGSIELPLAVGLIGGATAVHPVAKACLKILGVQSATELAEIMASVGLAQNLAALRALAVEGIQRGHMKLHARNIAVMAGASGDLIDKVAQAMIEERGVRMDRAKELLKKLKSG
ncbi:MAG: hydroxymethylglutaryl-CoA reductase, degradative [Nitrososphaeria archaeon]|nr:hydroxymethylglutaryl-CoA reductase, degradative [Nitrososphaeria archaeon]NIQ34305.1 hydroxymethylglutaryl-CoA reductase, degradative [Nitrososphaeria archaeon]